jgi:hypothetical protein
VSVSGNLGTLDTTLLENGYYELRVRARDVNQSEGSAQVLVRVDGQAKPGIVQLSFVDAVVPTAGIPISVVRSYDSRVKTREDFGFGWRLSLKQGVVQHNRTVGEGIAIYTAKQDFALACQGATTSRATSRRCGCRTASTTSLCSQQHCSTELRPLLEEGSGYQGRVLCSRG